MDQLKKFFYVFFIQVSSFIHRKNQQTRTIVYIMSFQRNGNLIIKELLQTKGKYNLIILYTRNCEEEAKKYQQLGGEIHPITHSLKFIFRIIPKISSAKVIICDNYFPFLAGIKKRKNSTIIQIWHASGAIKCFGWEDRNTKNRTFLDKRRFTKVYNSLDEYIVGSDIMGNIFEKSYSAAPYKIRKTGYPRSDIYFDEEKVARKRGKFYEQFPDLKNKRIILYAPTYRDLENETYPINIGQLKENFGNDSVLLIKQHPHLVNLLKEEITTDFFYYNLKEFKIEDLLPITDCLITDYSSVPFDYTILDNAKKIVFYCYDYEKYDASVGIQSEFKKNAPGKIVYTMDDLVFELSQQDSEDFTEFNNIYNKYNDGKATKRFIKHINELLNT